MLTKVAREVIVSEFFSLNMLRNEETTSTQNSVPDMAAVYPHCICHHNIQSNIRKIYREFMHSQNGRLQAVFSSPHNDLAIRLPLIMMQL